MQPVCCSGCEAVANLILQSGQSRYYQFRTENAPKPADEDAGIEGHGSVLMNVIRCGAAR